MEQNGFRLGKSTQSVHDIGAFFSPCDTIDESAEWPDQQDQCAGSDDAPRLPFRASKAWLNLGYTEFL